MSEIFSVEIISPEKSIIQTNTLEVVGVSTLGGVLDVDGSITCNDIVTAGALLHEGDTDTLVHFSAANTIQLKTGGSSRLLVNNFGINLENGYLNSNGNRIILGDSSGATDDRIVLGNNNDCFLYHDSTNTFIENSTGTLKILGDTIQLGEGNDKIGIGSDSPTSTLDVNGDVRVGSGVTLISDGDIFA